VGGLLGETCKIKHLDRRSRTIAGKIKGNRTKPSALKTLPLQRPGPGPRRRFRAEKRPLYRFLSLLANHPDRNAVA